MITLNSFSSPLGISLLSLPVLLTVPSAEPSLCSDEAPASAPAELQSTLANTVIQSTGAIEADLTAFRELLGNPINGAAVGTQFTGHREINWDGVPAAVTNVINFPSNFFNVNSTRGLIYGVANRGLEVSSQGFADINPTYATEFLPFSGTKTFSTLGTNVSDVQFRVAGSDTPAVVRGFGVVFMDVDDRGSTGFELLDQNGDVLAAVRAPVRSDARGASFVGIVFDNPVIARVRIVSGNGKLAPGANDISQGGEHDLVVMDDFLYGEPVAQL
jgi:hypothetical protein